MKREDLTIKEYTKLLYEKFLYNKKICIDVLNELLDETELSLAGCYDMDEKHYNNRIDYFNEVLDEIKKCGNG